MNLQTIVSSMQMLLSKVTTKKLPTTIQIKLTHPQISRIDLVWNNYRRILVVDQGAFDQSSYRIKQAFADNT